MRAGLYGAVGWGAAVPNRGAAMRVSLGTWSLLSHAQCSPCNGLPVVKACRGNTGPVTAHQACMGLPWYCQAGPSRTTVERGRQRSVLAVYTAGGQGPLLVLGAVAPDSAVLSFH